MSYNFVPDPVDVHVGEQLRRMRHLRNISQEKLAAALGVSFQQVQKYERGANRVSASMIWRACKALDCHPGDLFPPCDVERRHDPVADWLRSPDAVPLAQAVVRLPENMRAAVTRVARGLEGVH